MRGHEVESLRADAAFCELSDGGLDALDRPAEHGIAGWSELLDQCYAKRRAAAFEHQSVVVFAGEAQPELDRAVQTASQYSRLA